MLEFYPDGDKGLFYIEFQTRDGVERFRLFKRNYAPEERFKGVEDRRFICGELHPYQLLNGEVASSEWVTFETKDFLKFVVDSLNKNSVK